METDGMGPAMSVTVISTPAATAVAERLRLACPPGVGAIALQGHESADEIRRRVGALPADALVVLALLPEEGRSVCDLAQVDLPAWRACMTILPFTARVFQALRLAQTGRLTVVCLGAQIALTGSSGMAMLSAVQEGQRSLVKAAARQWGEARFHAHWVGLHPSELCPAIACNDVPQKQDSVIHALGQPPSLERVARMLPLLASRDADVLTGATLMAEGGGWMVP